MTITEERQDEIRKQYSYEIRKILLGPGSEVLSNDSVNANIEEEIITENPKNRYVTGILYSINDSKKKNLMNNKEVNIEEVQLNEDRESEITIDNNYFPSTIGVTTYCKSATKFEINYSFESSTYSTVKSPKFIFSESLIEEFLSFKFENAEFMNIFEINREESSIKLKNKSKEVKDILNDEKKKLDYEHHNNVIWIIDKFLKNTFYQRKPFKINNKINIISKNKIFNETIHEIDSDHKVEVFSKVEAIAEINKETVYAVTLVATNISDKNSLFQSKIKISKNISFEFVSNEDIKTPNLKSLSEEEAMNLFLYRNKKTYAVGHGISSTWSDENGGIKSIETEYMPSFEITPMSFTMQSINNDILKPHNYISSISKDTQLNYLNSFVMEYSKWIDAIKEKSKLLNEIYIEFANKNIQDCQITLTRMNKTIKLLEEDEKAFQCFDYANEAILLQRLENENDKELAYSNKDYSKSTFQWRPFQLAFILNSLESILNEESDDRDLLDLIYVTTGGGKTEAYLFAIAAVVLYRRLSYDNSDGVSVIMRYTLRLLTSQQFERASQLICSLEYIRKHNPNIFGNTEISIGLWIGKGTENKLSEAKERLIEMANSNSIKDAKSKNPFQVLVCPWCKKEDSLIPESRNLRNKRKWGYKEVLNKNNHYNMKCLNENCPFHSGLPIYVVDESIYKVRPTLVFGTVDKFAQTPIKEEAQNIFGSVTQDYRRPELIIQDELHLISGPLGSIVGLYEASFDYIMGHNNSNTRPKYIASTATIRNANQQVRGLFDREVHQFPPNGINTEDNFFIKEDTGKKGRQYLGIMPTGKSQITVEARLTAIMLEAVETIELSPEEKDIYWTLTGYFNSIRELGKAAGILMDDTKEYIRQLSQRNNWKSRHFYNNEELTSRIKGSEISEILSRLNTKYKDRGNKKVSTAVDTLIATNMISVGIDIPRLNAMFVVGQPKLTSEYIQSTSRVGRENLGLVCTLYNSSRSRDRSHYETFHSYHEKMYKFVESSSVTPFSLPSLEKALAAVIVNMLRNTSEILSGDTSPISILENISELEKSKAYLLKRLNNIEKYESFYFDEINKQFNNIRNKWIELAKLAQNDDTPFLYYKHNMSSHSFDGYLLLKNFEDKNHIEALNVMNSMREVEEGSSLKIREEGAD